MIMLYEQSVTNKKFSWCFLVEMVCALWSLLENKQSKKININIISMNKNNVTWTRL